MLCVHPFKTGTAEYGCGQCLPCRINRRRCMTGRLILEQLLHGDSCFATLTYAKTGPNLVREDYTKWTKLLRYHAGFPLRLFGVGEYGDKHGRPHFHVAIYGLSILQHVFIERSWQHGSFHVGDLNHNSATYLAGYVTKKWTTTDAPGLSGRTPEFSSPSRRPALAHEMCPHIAEQLRPHLSTLEDVPSTIRIGQKLYPLDHLMRKKIRLCLGLDGLVPLSTRRKKMRSYLAEPIEVKAIRDANRVSTYNTAHARARTAKTRKLL